MRHANYPTYTLNGFDFIEFNFFYINFVIIISFLTKLTKPERRIERPLRVARRRVEPTTIVSAPTCPPPRVSVRKGQKIIESPRLAREESSGSETRERLTTPTLCNGPARSLCTCDATTDFVWHALCLPRTSAIIKQYSVAHSPSSSLHLIILFNMCH